MIRAGGREVAEMSDHHLVPKSRGGRVTEPICCDCHLMIHVLYDNKTLERSLNTAAALLAEPRFARYVHWVQRRPGDRRYRARRAQAGSRRR